MGLVSIERRKRILQYVPAVSVLPTPGSPCSRMLSPFPHAGPPIPATLSTWDETMVSRTSLYSSSRTRRFQAFSRKDTGCSCDTLRNSDLKLDVARDRAMHTLTPHFVPEAEATHMLRAKHQCEIVHLSIWPDQIILFETANDNVRRTIC